MPRLLLRPRAVFDGETVTGGRVLVENGRITAVGPDVEAEDAIRVDLPEAMLLPGLIDLHTHILLIPYDRRS
jgi:imidazolonepropionase-like amidohydrolase